MNDVTVLIAKHAELSLGIVILGDVMVIMLAIGSTWVQTSPR
jgi:hypothetical protein